MANRKIHPVVSNKEKQETYTYQMRRYNKAMKEEFYLEAIMIDYAMLEDRLRSFLYHAAFLKDRNATGCWKVTKPRFASFVNQYKKKDEKENLGVSNISGKIKIVRCMLRWVNETNCGYQNDAYLKCLKNRCEGLDLGAIYDALDNIEEWCEYRNEVVHALLNKRKTSVDLNLENMAISGMKYARFIDSQLRILKRGDTIRRCVNAPRE